MITFAELQETDEWQALAKPAESYYSEALPYHNWGHALAVAHQVVELGNRCELRGLDLDIGLLAVAAAWHDAGFDEDHLEHHMPTKESYSAHLAETFLTKYGRSKLYVSQVGKAIIGTTHGVRRRGINMLALHRADVANIGGTYASFAAHSLRLLQERRLLDPNLSLDSFVEGCRLFIGSVIAESVQGELAGLGEPVTGDESFPVRALANITQLASETEKSLLQYAA